MALNESSFTGNATTGSQVVIGLFSNGNDAQQAIGELREQGFRTSQIGAAFRETAVGSEFGIAERGRAQSNDGIQDVSVGHNLTESSYTGSSSLDSGSLGGPASGSNAVTPAGLSTGTGPGISGAGRPGRIPGSDIPRSISNADPGDIIRTHRVEPGEDVQQDLRPDRVIDIAPGGTGADVTTMPNPAPSATYNEAERLNKHAHDHDSWWEKLKRAFTDDDSSTAVTEERAKSESKFGTGQGDLGLTSNQPTGLTESDQYDYAYSPAEFEGSLTSLGLDQRQARAFARELGSHGAIVTVAAGDRLSDAERVLERNHGRIRYEEGTTYESGTLEDPVSSTQGSYDPRERIQLFGEVRRAYRQRAGSSYDEKEIDRRDDLRRPA